MVWRPSFILEPPKQKMVELKPTAPIPKALGYTPITGPVKPSDGKDLDMCILVQQFAHIKGYWSGVSWATSRRDALALPRYRAEWVAMNLLEKSGDAPDIILAGPPAFEDWQQRMLPTHYSKTVEASNPGIDPDSDYTGEIYPLEGS